MADHFVKLVQRLQCDPTNMRRKDLTSKKAKEIKGKLKQLRDTSKNRSIWEIKDKYSICHV